MPRKEKDLDPDGGPVVWFAARLRQQRTRARLTYRELAARTPYSHAHMVRAASGDVLASWLVVRAYLVACGVTHPPVLRLWEQLWIATNDAIRADAGDPGVDLASALHHITTPKGFGDHLRAFSNRKKRHTLRALEQVTGVPRSTLADWFSGRRVPSVGRLYQFAGSLDATQKEQDELRQVRDRLDADQKSATALENFTLQVMAGSTADAYARLHVARALLGAGEQRLHNDGELSTWKETVRPSRSVLSKQGSGKTMTAMWQIQADLLAEAERRTTNNRGLEPGKLLQTLDELELPTVPTPTTEFPQE
ncbi:transcriptional regulator [Kribbella capetownensis]|uniref:Transcriptional regulator n=1 Tax=Kribbella capetownensis TaxID=1572659 RepID=A0A4R0IM18_9ACTN|nr:helix-turn-helix transcriptional regulator [Kribbella capetownensis]TCC33899.1 transcriptional regulator [Kribbella capetownensis]